jgi:hypothetical protein
MISTFVSSFRRTRNISRGAEAARISIREAGLSIVA